MFITQRTLKRLREESCLRGRRQALAELRSQLAYAISGCRLLETEGSRVPKKYQDAFSLLFPNHTIPDHVDVENLQAKLIKLEFDEQQAKYLVSKLVRYPDVLVVMLIALMSGLDEAAAWGLIQNI